MRPLLCLLLCLITTATLAQEPPALIVTKAGFYYVVTDTAGVPQLVRVTKVISIGDGGPDIPLPPDTPAPPANPVREQVAGWAREVNHPIGAQAMELVWTTVMDKHERGEISGGDVWPAIKQASDAVLAAPGVDGTAKWAGFRQKVGELITTKTQAGELTHPQQVVRFGRDVASGLKASSAAAPALSPELLDLIVRVIMRVIELLLGNNGPLVPGPV